MLSCKEPPIVFHFYASVHEEGRGRRDISHDSQDHIHAGVCGWHATQANMINLYQFSLCAAKNVVATVKVLSQEWPFGIMVKS